MTITTRPATADDTAFACAVHHAAYREVVVAQYGVWDDGQQDQFFSKDWANAEFIILLADSVPCGYACVEQRADDVHVRELVVGPSWQNQGIGSTFLRSVMAAAAGRGVPVRLGTQHRNQAQRLYRRLGFVEIDRTATHVTLEWTGQSPESSA